MDASTNNTSWTLLEKAKRDVETSDNLEIDSAWKKIAEIYFPVVHRWTMQFEIDESTVDDITQDVFTELWRRLPTIKRSDRKGAFRKYVKRIVFTKAMDYFRHVKGQPSSISESQLRQFSSSNTNESNDALSDSEDESLILNAVLACVEKYPGIAKEAYLLREQEKLSIKEIGEFQRRAEGTVKTSLSRFRKRLQLDLAAYQQHAIGQMLKSEIAVAQGRSENLVSKGIETIAAVIQESFSDLL